MSVQACRPLGVRDALAPPGVAAVGQRRLPEGDVVEVVRICDVVVGAVVLATCLSRIEHAFGLAGAEPKVYAVLACTSGVVA
jgi:hypothetical protein